MGEAEAAINLPGVTRGRAPTMGARCFVLALFGLLVLFQDAHASATPAESVTVVAGPQFRRSSLHRFFFGTDYRRLWTTPLRVPVLDMASEAGGLSVVRRVGGKQTKALALKGGDGRSYTFRGLEKDVAGLVEEELRGTVVESMVRDQFAAQHPASELVAGRLLKTLEIPSQGWRLVVLPDSPELGEFRKEFAGAAGTFGEFPTAPTSSRPGTFGLTEVVDHRELYRRIEAGTADQVDDQAFLRARLVDLFLGDWDRHRRQWRWAKFPGDPRWKPIPEDRDQAFSRYEGLVLGFVRRREPRFQNFGPEYGSIQGLTWNGREQDRRLMVGLMREDFQDAASRLRQELTDTALEEAVRTMPPEWRAIDEPRLLPDLKARRDGLPKIADRFYRDLAARVDVFLTNQADQADAVRSSNGDLTLTAGPHYRRVFHPEETSEIRLYLLDGDDRVTVTGPSGGGIRVRVIGGDGNDTLAARGSGPTKLSDSSGKNAAIGAALDDHIYNAPTPPADAPWIRPRDWGNNSWFTPWMSYGPDLGLFLGGGVELRTYGFRKDPYAARHHLRGGYAFGEGNGKLDYQGTYRRENRRGYWELHAYGSGVEVLRFYGFGNETPDHDDSDSTKVDADEVLLSVAYVRPFGRAAFWRAGVLGKNVDTEDEHTESLVNQLRPYGVGGFGELGAHAGFGYDTRDNPMFTRRGVRLGARGTLFPEAWSVKETFGEVNGDAAAWLPAGRSITLAVRAGGKRVFGRFPFHEAATIGGGALGEGTLDEPDYTLRGFRAQRFAGESSLWGNSDLRLRLSRITLILPGHWGLFGLADVGRVWSDGEDSERWHSGVGGGIWISVLGYRGTGSAGIAHSSEGDRFYFKGGFTF